MAPKKSDRLLIDKNSKTSKIIHSIEGVVKNDCTSCPILDAVACPLMFKAEEQGLDGIHKCEMRLSIEVYSRKLRENYARRYGTKEKRV